MIVVEVCTKCHNSNRHNLSHCPRQFSMIQIGTSEMNAYVKFFFLAYIYRIEKN